MYVFAFDDVTYAVTGEQYRQSKFLPEFVEIPLEHVVCRGFYSRKG